MRYQTEKCYKKRLNLIQKAGFLQQNYKVGKPKLKKSIDRATAHFLMTTNIITTYDLLD